MPGCRAQPWGTHLLGSIHRIPAVLQLGRHLQAGATPGLHIAYKFAWCGLFSVPSLSPYTRQGAPACSESYTCTQILTEIKVLDCVELSRVHQTALSITRAIVCIKHKMPSIHFFGTTASYMMMCCTVIDGARKYQRAAHQKSVTMKTPATIEGVRQSRSIYLLELECSLW